MGMGVVYLARAVDELMCKFDTKIDQGNLVKSHEGLYMAHIRSHPGYPMAHRVVASSDQERITVLKLR